MKRTEKEVRELALCLSHFPKFLPSVAYGDSLRLVVASRAIGEITHKESCSCKWIVCVCVCMCVYVILCGM